jgi:hypothetical protein
VGRGGKDTFKNWFGFLGVPETGNVARVAAARAGQAQQMLDDVEQHIEKNLEAHELIPANTATEQLGLFDDMALVWKSMRGKDTTNALREALEKLDYDQSFKFDVAEKMNEELVDLVGPEINFLLSGHTHFHRSLPLGPSAHHFNSGTWAYLMQLTEAVRTDEVAFNALIAALKAKSSLAQLDAKGHLIKRHTVIRIAKTDDASVRGELLMAKVSAAGKFSLDTVVGSERTL